MWDRNCSEHEFLIAKAELEDKQLVGRDFVRVECVPKTFEEFSDVERWHFRVDDEGTLPVWFEKNRDWFERETRRAAREAISEYVEGIKRVTAFLNEIKKIKWFEQQGEIKRSWKIFYGETLDAARAAAKYAVRTEVWNAALTSVKNDINVDLDEAGRTINDVMYNAIRAKVWDAVITAATAKNVSWAATGDIARDAVNDATLSAQCLLISDKIDKKHIEHMREMMEVWKQGYGVLVDVNGKLIVYGVNYHPINWVACP